jgi:hypothetical protein
VIRVDQTRFGCPSGNCFQACMASLLELPLEEVPDFMAADPWWPAMEAWLAPRGLYPVGLLCEGQDSRDGWVPRGLHILGGRSPRGDFDHVVIAHGREIVWDPHPSRAGLVSWKDRVLLVHVDPVVRGATQAGAATSYRA